MTVSWLVALLSFGAVALLAVAVARVIRDEYRALTRPSQQQPRQPSHVRRIPPEDAA